MRNQQKGEKSANTLSLGNRRKQRESAEKLILVHYFVLDGDIDLKIVC